MGSSNKKLKPEVRNMKLATVLAATASANVSSYIAEHWWNEAVNVFNFANSNWDQFAAAANSVDDSQWKPLWTFCNANGDGEISSDELTSCAAAAANYVGMSENTQGFLYNFGAKYWNVVDQDNSGSLNYFVTSALTENAWNPSADDINAVKAA